MTLGRPIAGAVYAAALPSVLGIVSIFAALTVAEPRAGPLAAVFPPWWESARVLQAAASAGRIAGFGSLPFVVLIVPEIEGAADRLKAEGAWLLLPPAGRGGCAAAREI